VQVAFDSQIFLMQQYGGASKYFANLADRLDRKECEVAVCASIHRNSYLAALRHHSLNGYYLPLFPEKAKKVSRVFNNFVAEWKFRRGKASILHETWYNGSRRKVGRVVVTTVFDMIQELYPELFGSRDKTAQHKKRSVMEADHVFCISENTRQDLIRIYDIPHHKTSVTHLACDAPVAVGSRQTAEFAASQPYILYVGQRSGYKNFSSVIEAVASDPEIKKNFRIIAFGGGSFTETEKKSLDRLGFSGGMVVQTAGGDALLADYYAKASALVYPSQYEGFGIPPLEAMSYGCPVVASNASCLPEIIGEAGEYFDPVDTQSLKQALSLVLSDQSHATHLRELGFQRLTRFSWEKCARGTLDQYKKLAS
jgi:glycosyltransferase involved in cell wall biosynthesis